MSSYDFHRSEFLATWASVEGIPHERLIVREVRLMQDSPSYAHPCADYWSKEVGDNRGGYVSDWNQRNPPSAIWDDQCDAPVPGPDMDLRGFQELLDVSLNEYRNNPLIRIELKRAFGDRDSCVYAYPQIHAGRWAPGPS